MSVSSANSSIEVTLTLHLVWFSLIRLFNRYSSCECWSSRVAATTVTGRTDWCRSPARPRSRRRVISPDNARYDQNEHAVDSSSQQNMTVEAVFDSHAADIWPRPLGAAALTLTTSRRLRLTARRCRTASSSPCWPTCTRSRWRTPTGGQAKPPITSCSTSTWNSPFQVELTTFAGKEYIFACTCLHIMTVHKI